MILSPVFLRVCLVLCLVGMALIAALYLRRRVLTWWEYLAWGLFMLLFPIAGPFLTILCQPGTPRSTPLRRAFQHKLHADKTSN
ncbi:MAG: hypothetical protein A2Z49_03075 [Chloroflexi bacterium RBG_19FT_COMBO_56_12]|jgi:hypothetical protein|nr:MAG: hypothetical protein A2Z49_03075 [Chloroflexi bacterium RBG_19FT_COMBO_56_12]